MIILLLILAFFSGAAGLIYEVLWLKQLGYLFGNTAQASAVTLSTFFIGLGLGNWWWGKFTKRSTNFLRVFSWVECGIFVSGLFYFFVIKIFHVIYPAVFNLSESLHLGILIKFILAVILICPSAFFMGGTIPVLVQIVVKKKNELGKKGTGFYGINTLGATLGAFIAGFVLPLKMGYQNSYIIALVISFSLFLITFVWSKPSGGNQNGNLASENMNSKNSEDDKSISNLESPGLTKINIYTLSFISGFTVLGLQVVWTQMFSHVLQNTIYTFSAILVSTLICLFLGAIIAHGLTLFNVSSTVVLVTILGFTSIVIGSSSFIFFQSTNGLSIVTSGTGWQGYIQNVFKQTLICLAPALILLGILFPYLMKVSEKFFTRPGETLGNLIAVNTIGAVLGSLISGFLLIKWMGIWNAVYFFACLYLMAGLYLFVIQNKLGLVWKFSLLVFAIGFIWILKPSSLVPMKTVENEKIVEVWNGASGTVGVIQRDKNKIIKINGHYSLGSTQAEEIQKNMTRIPLLLKPDAKSIFFLGLGTGITASEALSKKYNIEKVVSCELVKEVITASKKHFSSLTKALFEDSRSKVIHDDGRHYLTATKEKFDVINSDLFVVYRRGAGSLYTLEHFKNVKKRLNPGGIFVQWIPMYQLTEKEFSIIANTLNQVFPQITLWRSHFKTFQDVVGLVAQTDETPLFKGGYKIPDLETRKLIQEQAASGEYELNANSILLNYCGNLGAVKKRLNNNPVNTDNYPYIECLTPKSSQMQASDQDIWFSGPKFITFMDQLFKLIPPSRDPALKNLPQNNRNIVKSGYHLARAHIFYRGYKEKVGGVTEPWLRSAEQAKVEFSNTWLDEGPIVIQIK